MSGPLRLTRRGRRAAASLAVLIFTLVVVTLLQLPVGLPWTGVFARDLIGV